MREATGGEAVSRGAEKHWHDHGHVVPVDSICPAFLFSTKRVALALADGIKSQQFLKAKKLAIIIRSLYSFLPAGAGGRCALNAHEMATRQLQKKCTATTAFSSFRRFKGPTILYLIVFSINLCPLNVTFLKGASTSFLF